MLLFFSCFAFATLFGCEVCVKRVTPDAKETNKQGAHFPFFCSKFEHFVCLIQQMKKTKQNKENWKDKYHYLVEYENLGIN